MFIHNLLENTAKKMLEKVAIICTNGSFTFRQVNEYCDNVAAKLLDFGMKSMDRVIICMDNSVEAYLSIFGVLKAGGVIVVVNNNTKPRKLQKIIADSGARIIIFKYSKLDALKSFNPDILCNETLVYCESELEPQLTFAEIYHTPKYNLNVKSDTAIQGWNRTCAIENNNQLDPDLAALIYTTGSSGEPKGIMAGHSNIIAAVKSITKYLENVEDDIILNVLPLSFDYGLYQLFMVCHFGGTIVIEKSFTYPVKILQRIVEKKVTGFPIVPTMAKILVERLDMDRYDLSSLRYISSTGEPFPPKHIYALKKYLRHTKIFSMYGLTECKRVSYVPPDKLTEKIGSVGIPIPGVNVKIIKENGNEVCVGEIGELIVQGPNVMRGYWNDPAESSRVFRTITPRGGVWLFTGDLFKRDEDGYLYFVSRKDDLLKIKGDRVSPKETETILYDLEGISEVAVVGIIDDQGIKCLKATIVVEKGYSIDEKKIMNHCRKNLNKNLVPKFIEFLDSLPKNSNGKIDKAKLSATSKS